MISLVHINTLCRQCTLPEFRRNKSLGFVILVTAALALWPYMSCDVLCLYLMHLLKTKCVSSSVPLQAVAPPLFPGDSTVTDTG